MTVPLMRQAELLQSDNPARRQHLATDVSAPVAGPWDSVTPQLAEPARYYRGFGKRITSLILPSVSLVLAMTALGIALFRDPLGSGISKYDFSTPRAALESRMKIEINKDIRAMIEFENRVHSKQQKERLDTLEVRKEVEFRGKKVLFVAFKANGVNKYSIEGFEKDANTGYWLPSGVYDFEVEKDNKELAEQMRRWEKSGELGSAR